MIEGYYGCKAPEIFVFVVLIRLEIDYNVIVCVGQLCLSCYSDFKKLVLKFSLSPSFLGGRDSKFNPDLCRKAITLRSYLN